MTDVRAASGRDPKMVSLAVSVGLVVVGLSAALVGVALGDTSLLVTGMVAGGFASIAVDGLVATVRGWRRRSGE